MPSIRAALICVTLATAYSTAGASGINEDFEAEGALSTWSIKTESGSLDVAEGCGSPRGAQVSGKQVELSRYEKDGLWTNLDGAGTFEVSFLIQKGVSWRLVLAGQDGHGFVVYISAKKIEVSFGGNNWWEAQMQTFPIPDITGKWMTLRLTPLEIQPTPGERLKTGVTLFETESPDNKYAEDLAVAAAGPETGAPFRRISEIRIFEWSSGKDGEDLHLDNIRLKESN
ncbi:MAG: hypothetical protein BGO12_19815 [Verrucomicrobia bacterium 61-8]|nr:hypothetical protein [Verrucomicrobiota bacterium]OJV04216.1 MAG: hypothetical protein BGO12_19815 [Verrucomicrobia bacterium 61-8]